jgi:hypothetical protein
MKTEHVVAVWEATRDLPGVSNMRATMQTATILSIEDALEAYRASGYLREDWSKVHANALKANKEDGMDQLQEAILT